MRRKDMTEQLKLWDICVFNYLIGNTDNHIKNLSLLYDEDLKTVRLAPAYDIISTVVYENSMEDMALCIGEKYHIYDIDRSSFEQEAERIGLGRKMAMNRFDVLVDRFETALKEARNELIDQGFAYTDVICEQILNRGGIRCTN